MSQDLEQGLRWEAAVTSDDPDEQVEHAIALMSGYVRADSHTPELLKDAAQAVPAGVDPIQGIYDFVQRRIRFQRDEVTGAPIAGLTGLPIVEVLIRPRDMATIYERVGDCDDFSMYTAALLRAHGIKSRFVTVAGDPQEPGAWSHVYVAAYPEGRGRIPMDVSHGGYPGWEYMEGAGPRKTEWPIEREAWPLLIALLVLLALFGKRTNGQRRLSWA